MTRRTPQPIQEIEERIELLKTTLGLFAPGEPVPIAQELCELGEGILVHRLLAHGAPLAADGSLADLADEMARRDSSLAAARDVCREMLRLKGAIADAPDDPETGTRLVALAAAAGELAALAAQ